MTDSKSGLWSEPCYVYTHDVGPGGKMSFAAIARYFQEAAWHSAEALGFGYAEATRLKQFWVLVRQSIKAHRLPAWGERLVIETWPRGVDGLWAFRDYYIRDLAGNVCVGATSSWMIMDANTHRPLKPEIVYGAIPWVIETKAIGETARKIVHEGSWEIGDRRKVRFSDMDINGHMNNSRYVEWISDAMYLQNKKNTPRELEINYLAEAREEDLILIHLSEEDHRWFIKGERESDKRLVFIASIGQK